MLDKTWFKRLILVSIDTVALVFTAYFSLALRFDFKANAQMLLYSEILQKGLPVFLITGIGFIFLFGLYRSLWRYASIRELIYVGLAALWSTMTTFVVLSLLKLPLPRSVYLVYMLVFMAIIGGMRFAYGTYRRLQIRGVGQGRPKQVVGQSQNVLVLGAGRAGLLVVREMLTTLQNQKRVVGILDDNASIIGRTIEGVKVLGPIEEVDLWVERLAVDEVVLAIPSLNYARRQEILNQCKALKVKLRILPGLFQIIDGHVDIKKIRDVAIEDLLGRDAVQFDDPQVRMALNDKVVLITGAGGSIGSELSRQIATYMPRRLVLLDIYENGVYDLQLELQKRHAGAFQIDVLIGSVRDVERIDEVFAQYRPQYVFHAAAHKHVPLMQTSPFEAIRNNTFGTFNVAKAAGKYGAQRMVLISTDKAVNPTNIMGASKRLAELAILWCQRQFAETKYMAVRFGNVLGSNGSVVPVFKRQIEAGGPVTVTHPEIIRYFMTIPEAVQLVLQSGTYARGGDIFILDMGEPVSIVKLAEDLIRLSGYIPYQDIDIHFTGLRPGEKLFEELLLSEEGIEKTANERIFIGKVRDIDYDSLEQVFDGLLNALSCRSVHHLEMYVEMLIPTYRKIENN